MIDRFAVGAARRPGPIAPGAALAVLLVCCPPARAQERPFFDGVDAPSAAVLEKARADIEWVRKGDFVVRFRLPDGTALGGPVRIEHVEHEFRFGGPFSAGGAFLDLFNTGRMNPHWRNLQSGEDGPAGRYLWEHYDRMLAEAHERSIAMRWHCLIYEQWGSPAWIEAKYRGRPWWGDVPDTEEDWWHLIERHIRTVAQHPHPVTGEPIGSTVEFDVINETGSRMWTNIRLEEAGKGAAFPSPHNRHPRGNANAARIICLARKYMPEARLVVLEGWPIGDLNDGSTRRIYRHFERLFDPNSADPNVRRLAGDPRVLIGSQGHFSAVDRSAITMARIDAGLEHFARLGKQIAITEYDPPTVARDRQDLYPLRLSPEEQAAWSVHFHTLAFSKPYIVEICRWAFNDRQGQKADAGLLFADGRKKPEYDALRRLFRETWSTRVEGELDAQGAVAFRGFFGTYRAVLPGREPVRFALASSTARRIDVTVPQDPAPADRP